ncbi:MAG: MFS transporter [Promethearchaeota archaeon]
MNAVKLRKLKGIRVIGYTATTLGMFLNNIFFSVFIFQFYVYTINLDSIFVSIGVSINAFVAAIVSIISGVVADNKKPNKLGKRRVLMLYGMPIWFLATILIWNPPWYCPPDNQLFLPTALFFWTITMIRALSGSFILTVHTSMLPEQSQTHQNREKIASWNTFFSITASVFSLMLPLLVQSLLEDPQNVKWWQPSGKIVLLYVPLIGFLFASLGILTMLFTFFSVDESFHARATKSHEKRSIKKSFKQMLKPARNKEFKKFLIVRFLHSSAGKILGIVIIPFLTYTLKFKETEFLLYVLVSITSKYCLLYLWKKILNRKGLISSYFISVEITLGATFLIIFFLFEDLAFWLKIFIFVVSIGTILGNMYAFGLFTTPITGALIHDEAEKTMLIKMDISLDSSISQISGSYFGLQGFIEAVGIAFASLLIGFILTGENQKNASLITLCLLSMSLFYIISLFFLKKIKINNRTPLSSK